MRACPTQPPGTPRPAAQKPDSRRSESLIFLNPGRSTLLHDRRRPAQINNGTMTPIYAFAKDPAIVAALCHIGYFSPAVQAIYERNAGPKACPSCKSLRLRVLRFGLFSRDEPPNALRSGKRLWLRHTPFIRLWLRHTPFIRLWLAPYASLFGYGLRHTPHLRGYGSRHTPRCAPRGKPHARIFRPPMRGRFAALGAASRQIPRTSDKFADIADILIDSCDSRRAWAGILRIFCLGKKCAPAKAYFAAPAAK